MGVIEHFKEFLGYLKRPSYNYKRENPISLIKVTQLFFLVFAIELLMFIPISFLIGIDSLPHAMETIMEEFSGLQVFVLAVILAPFTEELMFRFHLRYRPLIFLFLIICLTAFNYLLVGEPLNLDSHEAMHNPSLALESISRYLPYIGLMALVFLLYLFINKFRKMTDKLIVGEFAFVFYLTATIFALIHIFNFQLGDTAWYLTPLLVLPQFILALYLGYIRVRNNIFYSIYVHMLNNALPMFMIYLASLSGGLQ